jgi:endo-1,4-beta-xylanase
MPALPQGMGESVFVRELIPHIDATYRTWGTREGRALEGYSQGGRGTTSGPSMRIGRSRPFPDSPSP